MWHSGWDGVDWAVMTVSMLAFWALVIFGVVWAIRTVQRGGGATRPPGGANAREILDERFARGEIDADEYRARRDLLTRP